MTELNGQDGANGNRIVPQANGKATYSEKNKVPEHFIGGNRLENAPASKVKDFVASHDGHTVITNVRASFTLPKSSRSSPIQALTISAAGPDRQQRYRCRQRDPVRP